MTSLNRRNFLGLAGSGVAAAVIAAAPRVAHASSKPDDGSTYTKLREQTETTLRSLYRAKNNLDFGGFISNFGDDVVYQDATLGMSIPGLKNVSPIFAGLFKTIASPGKLSEFTYGTGDVTLGAAAEFVDLPKSFANTAYDAMTILVMRDGKILRNTDYWDSAQLASADVYGPANKTGIAFPAVPVHPNGLAESRTASAFPAAENDNSHASPELQQFVTRFHDELSKGNYTAAAKFFADDALLIHPLLHRGDYGYGPFNETIQIRGVDNIVRMLKAALPVLPDGANSQLLHVVGGPAGGGYEWRAGGVYSNKGFDRKGIQGATSIDLFRNRIRRLSVKFDTVQMTAPVRDSVRKVLADANLGQES